MKNWKFAALLMSLSAVPSAAWAHAFLDHAQPAVGSTLPSSPSVVKIWFTEEIDPSGTAIKVFNASGKEVDRENSVADHKDNKLDTVGVDELPSGEYKVVWKALCMAGHTTGGSYYFTVK